MFNMSFNDLQVMKFWLSQIFVGTSSQVLHRATLQDRNTSSLFPLSCSELYLLKWIPPLWGDAIWVI